MVPEDLQELPPPAIAPLPGVGNAVFDFNHDGINDLVLTPTYFKAKPDLPMIWWKGTKDGFTDVTASLFPGGVPLTANVRTPIVADLNGDGIPDYFAADTGQEIIDPSTGQYIFSTNRLVLSNADGTFSDATSKLPFFKAFNHGACAADIDGDGRIDIVVAPLSAPHTYLIMNTTSGFEFNQSRLPTELTALWIPA